MATNNLKGSLIKFGFYFRRLRRTALGTIVLGSCVAFAYAETDVHIESVTTSPRGTFRIEQERKWDSGMQVGTITAWIIPAADSGQRVRLDEPFDDTKGRHFFISPDEQSICATVHQHSQLQSLMLYRRENGLQFKLVATEDEEGGDGHHLWDFDKNDRFGPKADLEANETGRVYNYFVAWSSDSARLLVERRSQLEAKKDGEHAWRRHYFYFNLRRAKLEHTQYLRALNRAVRNYDAARKEYVVPAFAEPLDALRWKRNFATDTKPPRDGSTRPTRHSWSEPRMRRRSRTVETTSGSGSRRANLAPRLLRPWDRKQNARVKSCYISPMPPRTGRMSWRSILKSVRAGTRRTKSRPRKPMKLRRDWPRRTRTG